VAIDQINYEDALWAAHGYIPDDLYDAALWAAHDLNNRLQRPDLRFTLETTKALLKVIDAVNSLRELEGWDGFAPIKLPANFFEQEAAQ